MVPTAHACLGALWVRVKRQCHIRGLLTKFMQYKAGSKCILWGVSNAVECTNGRRMIADDTVQLRNPGITSLIHSMKSNVILCPHYSILILL